MSNCRKNLLIVLHLLWVVVLAMASPYAITADPIGGHATHEYQVKAAFLYNFVKFTEWPANAFRHPEDPIRIAVVGPDRFGEAFTPFQAKSLKGRSIEFIHHHENDDILGCHVAFFTRTTQATHDCRLLKKPFLPVLTVGETPGFCNRGGMINFVMTDKKIRFEINPDAAEDAGLKISSKLLHLATIVREGKQMP